MSNDYTWDTQFLDLFHQCVDRYKKGDADYTQYYDDEARELLEAIGYKPREFFDFVEDYADEQVPRPSTTVLIAAVRRDYFLTVQKGGESEDQLTPDALPGRTLELGGYQWLPRIIAKARAKLRGELHPDVMYSCGGDRGFLSRHNIHPADFLRITWAAGENDWRILEYVQKSSPEK